MASGHQRQEQQRNIDEGRIKTLVNDDLKNICRAHGYQVSGTKHVLQQRCIEILNDTYRQGNSVEIDKLKYRIDHHGRDPDPRYTTTSSSNYAQSSYQNYDMAPQRGGAGLPTNGKYFKSSPFYEILETLVPLQDLPDQSEMPQNRHTVRAEFLIQPHIAEQFRKESNLKILMYCGEYSGMSPYSQANVSFPNQIEVKVNDNDVKANFKGLKNKPGSTKPADITSFVKKFQPQTKNSIVMTYALTTRRFGFLVYLVRHIGPDKLTERIKRHSVIRKQKVLEAMSRANADPDIAATSIRMSLKDPISTLRITVPVRSSHCTHNQCFDGVMFMQLQEQAPQWSCPVCSKNITFDDLAVDEYFQEILDRTPKTTEKVDIEPNGEWKVIKDEDDESDEAVGPSNKRGRASYDDDFDDLIELDQPDNKKVNGVKREPYQSLVSPIGGAPLSISTPPVSSREASVTQTSGRSSNKRPQSAVIDLTISDDDEDDQPPRPAKRQHTSHRHHSSQSTRTTSYNTPTSIPDTRYQQPSHNPPAQQQDTSFRPPSSHNNLTQPNFHAPSISPPYQPSPPMLNQNTWSPTAAVSSYQRHSATPSYASTNGPNGNTGQGGAPVGSGSMYPPRSPITLRPPPAQQFLRGEQREGFYPGQNSSSISGYNTGGGSGLAYSPRPPEDLAPTVGQDNNRSSGLRLPPLSSTSPPPPGNYDRYTNPSGGPGSGWRSDYEYGTWSQSPGG